VIEWIVFLAGALICAAGAFGVVRAENPVHAALSLVGTLFGIAVLFISRDAEFLAAVQVIVYAGAIVVLFLFVIMLLGVDRSDDVETDPLVGQRLSAAVVSVVLFVGLSAVLILGSITGQPSTGGAIDAGSPNVTQIARSLFTDHLWAFEITSVLLVIAVVGAVTLARHRGEALVDDAHPGDDVPTSATAEERA